MISPDTETPISNAGVTRTLLLCNTAAAVSATDVIAAGSLDCYRDCWAQHMAVILRHTHDEDDVAPAHDEDGAAPACVATDGRRHSPPPATRDGEDGTPGDWAQQACEVADTEKTANCTEVD